jgi:transposase-like protein
MMSRVSEKKMGEMMMCLKGAHVEQDVIQTGVPWYVVYPLGARQTEAIRQERGVHGC